jgi:hypothetical protein
MSHQHQFYDTFFTACWGHSGQRPQETSWTQISISVCFPRNPN